MELYTVFARGVFLCTRLLLQVFTGIKYYAPNCYWVLVFLKIIKLYVGINIKKNAVTIEITGAPAEVKESDAAIDHGTKGATTTALFS